VTETPRKPKTETLTDRQLLERIDKVAQHIDGMVHEVHQMAARAEPLLKRFTASPVGKYFSGRGRTGG
jgi:hypothetical protein